jgi:hypothetical protein
VDGLHRDEVWRLAILRVGAFQELENLKVLLGFETLMKALSVWEALLLLSVALLVGRGVEKRRGMDRRVHDRNATTFPTIGSTPSSVRIKKEN